MKGKNNQLKVSFNSPVILMFATICLIAFGLDQLTGGLANRWIFSTYASSPTDPITYVRLIGHVFGHASWEHLMGNMMTLLIIGPLLEEKYGSLDLGVMVGAIAIVTGVLHNIMFPNVQLLGASGVVFAFIVLSSFTSIKQGTIPLTFILVIIVYLTGEIYDGLFTSNNIANMTHIIGGIVGAILGYLMNRYTHKINR